MAAVACREAPRRSSVVSHRGCTELQAEVSGGRSAAHLIFPHVFRRSRACERCRPCPRLSRAARWAQHHQAAAAWCLHLQNPMLGVTSATALLPGGPGGGGRGRLAGPTEPLGLQSTTRPRRRPRGGSRRCGDEAGPPFPLLAVQHPSGRMTLPLPKLAAFFPSLLSFPPPPFWLSDELYAKSICSCLP